MQRSNLGYGSILFGSVFLLSCGNREAPNRLHRDPGGRVVSEDGNGVTLKKFEDESVVETAVLSFSKSGKLSLEDESDWTVELEDRKEVTSNVSAQKYLRVTGALKSASIEGQSEIGCLQIELKDNVNYRELGWLRIATTGISGDKYSEVRAPIFINQNNWTKLPILSSSITLGKFLGDTVKKFDGSVCFKIDTKDLPAQTYKGQVVIQYLKSGATHDEDVVDVSKFTCAQEPLALNAGQSAAVSFKIPPGIGQLAYSVRTNPASNTAGTVSGDPQSTAGLIYIAPENPSASFKAMIEARPENTRYLPVFCEIHVIAKSDIGVGDDGEIQGLTGNIFKLAENTPRLPDFTKLNSVSQIVVGNLDIPERAFSAGFPGVADLFEWFGIQFRGTITIPAGCESCKFKVVSDDGSKVYLDSRLIIDNDGTHPTLAKEGQFSASQGEHQIQIDYFQGPRYHITLQFYWDLGDGKGYQIVPTTAFKRPLN